MQRSIDVFVYVMAHANSNMTVIEDLIVIVLHHIVIQKLHAIIKLIKHLRMYVPIECTCPIAQCETLVPKYLLQLHLQYNQHNNININDYKHLFVT